MLAFQCGMRSMRLFTLVRQMALLGYIIAEVYING
jgi:hypothetical protein